MRRCMACGSDAVEYRMTRMCRSGAKGAVAREYRCTECGAGGNCVVREGNEIDRNGPAFELDWNDRGYDIRESALETGPKPSRGETV